MRQVWFIDTSVLANILNVPGKCQKHDEIIKELREHTERKDILILPLATIIETGNHISHISNGDARWKCANNMKILLENTINNKAPWAYNNNEIDKDSILRIADKFPDAAMCDKMGMGDLSIIEASRKYKDEHNGLVTVHIWTLDHHLKSYE